MGFITINGSDIKKNDYINISSSEFNKLIQNGGGDVAYSPTSKKFIVLLPSENRSSKIRYQGTDCETIFEEKDYRKGKFLNSGKYGEVSELCHTQKECMKKIYKYVIKIQPLKTKYKEQGHLKEVDIYNILQKRDPTYKYHVQMIDNWICEDKGYIVLIKKDGSMADLLESKKFKLNHLKNVIKLISNIHELDIVHLDVLPGNILFDDKGLYFTDFGLSFNSKHMKKQDLLNHQAFDYYLFMNKLERLGVMNKKFKKEFNKVFAKLVNKGWSFDKSSKSFVYKDDKYWIISKFNKRARKLSQKRKK